MNKHTFEELMAMDKDALQTLKNKIWDIQEILRAERNSTGHMRPTYIYDVLNTTRAIIPASAVIATAYIGYKAVKYYVDNMPINTSKAVKEVKKNG